MMEHEKIPLNAQSTRNPQCHDLLSNLSEFIDGTLKEELCNQIQQHMEGCENCRIVVDTLRRTVILYQTFAADPPEMPEEVRERLYRSLALDEFLKRD
jgi:predicted anti-sigma-YlaC factor YlaD